MAIVQRLLLIMLGRRGSLNFQVGRRICHPSVKLPQSLRCVYAKPLRVIESLTNELEAYTSERKIGLLRLVRLILTADH